MERCFICMNNLDNTFFLPYNDEYFGQNISIYKNNFIIRDVDNYKILYLLVCNTCIDIYLKKYGKIDKYLSSREIGVKI